MNVYSISPENALLIFFPNQLKQEGFFCCFWITPWGFISQHFNENIYQKEKKRVFLKVYWIFKLELVECRFKIKMNVTESFFLLFSFAMHLFIICIDTHTYTQKYLFSPFLQAGISFVFSAGETGHIVISLIGNFYADTIPHLQLVWEES